MFIPYTTAASSTSIFLIGLSFAETIVKLDLCQFNTFTSKIEISSIEDNNKMVCKLKIDVS